MSFWKPEYSKMNLGDPNGRYSKGEDYMNDWMTEEDGIPHKNGKVRFYLIGIGDGMHRYLGWYDMTDWDKGWEKVFADATQKVEDDEDFQVLRHDQLEDLSHNVQSALFEALIDEDETTPTWWWKQAELKEKI